MPKPLTADQLTALRAVPVGSMPNKLRIALALSQAKQSEVSEETGYAASSLSQVVNGRAGVTVDTARNIAAFFGCSIEDLFPAREAERASA
jgi:transcriptional regulator with XRE-family HTH domain